MGFGSRTDERTGGSLALEPFGQVMILRALCLIALVAFYLYWLWSI